MLRSLARSFSAAALAVLAAAPAAQAAWTPPQLIPGSESAGALQSTLDVDGRGRALATWLERFEGEEQVEGTATRAQDGTWAAGPTVRDAIGPPVIDVYAQTRAILLALRPSGESFPSDWDVRVRFGRSDGTFGPSRLLARGPSADGAVDASDDGRAAAVWATGRTGPTVVKAAIRPAGRSFGTVITLSETYARNPAVAVAENGDVVAAWWRKTGRGRRIEARIRRVGDPRWRDVAEVAALSHGAPRTVATGDSAGRFVVAWQAHDIGSGGDDLGVLAGLAVRPRLSGWRARELSDTPTGGRFEHPAIDAEYVSANDALVAWSAPVDGRHRVQVTHVHGTSRRSTETLAGPRDISGGEPDLAIGPGRQALVAWLETSEEIEPIPPVTSSVVASVGGETGGFGPASTLSGPRPAAVPRAAWTPGGEALVTWREQFGITAHAMFASSGP